MSSDAAAYFPNALRRSQGTPTTLRNELQLTEASIEQLNSLGVREVQTSVATSLFEPSDEELLNETGGGGRDALGVLFRRHAHRLRNIAWRILQDRAEADDLLQEVFLLIYRKAALFDSSKGSARSWINQIVYHRAFNRRHYLTARRHYQALQLDEEILDPRAFGPETPNGSSSIDAIFGQELLANCRTHLSPEQMQIIELFFFEGHTLKEIAELTGQSLSNVRSYYYRGLDRLRKFVTPEKARTK